MAEKRVVLDEKTGRAKQGSSVVKKKKKNCCCSCLITTLIVVVVILGAGVGVGWYFGNQYTSENLNMSLGECFSVLRGLYSPNEKKIVTNGYTDEDLNDFYSQLKHAVFLKDSVDVSVERVYELIKNEDSALPAKSYGAADSAAANGDADSANAIMQYISTLFTKENVDFDRLGSYDESKHEEYLLKIKDKGLAAFVNKLLVLIIADNTQITDQLQQFGIDDPLKYIELNQIILAKESRNVGVDDGNQVNVELKEVTTVKLTAHLKLVEAIKTENFIPNSFLASLAHFAIKALLPDDVYVTAKTGLNYMTGVDIFINNIDTEQKSNQAFKLLDGIMALAGSNESMKDTIDDMMTQNVKPFLEQAETYIDFSKVSDGSLNIDPFSAIIELTGINEEMADEDKLNGSQVLSVLSGVIGSDYANAVLPDYTFNNQHTSSDTSSPAYNSFYQTVYNPAAVDNATLVDYKEEFLNEVADKYLINLDPDNIPDSGDEIHFADFMAMFGVGTSDKTLDLMKLIDGSRMSELLGEEDYSKLSVNINDRMMGAIVSETISGILSSSDFSRYGIQVEQIIMREYDVSGNGDVRQFLELGMSINLYSVLDMDADPMIMSVLKAFLPEKVMLSVNMDITKDLGEKQPVKTQIKYNDLTAEETDRILEIIGRFAQSLSVDELMAQVEEPMREMLNQMYSLIGSVKFTQSKVVLPSVFKLMEELLFTETDENGIKAAVVRGEDIKDMLSSLTGSDDENYVSEKLGIDEAASNYDGFIGEIKAKYYINTDVTVNTFDDIFNVVNLSSFNADSFNIEKLKSDNASASELSPVFTDSEMAHMFQEVMASNPALGDFASIRGIQIRENNGNPYIKLAIEMNLSGFGEDVSKILPVQRIYAVATCYVNSPLTDENGEQYYSTEITINEMTHAQKATLQKMLNHLQGSAAIDLDAQSKELGKLIYRQLQTVQSSLGEGGFEFVEVQREGKTVGGLQLMSFYEFLAKATGIDTSNTDYGNSHEEVIDNIKGAIQGLYEKTEQAGSTNNFSVDDIIKNAAKDVDLTTPQGIAESFEQIPSLSSGLTGQMADNRFGGYLKSSFEGSVGQLKELTILSQNSDKAVSRRDEIASFGVNLEENKDYMYIVVRVDFSKIAAGEGSTVIGSFLPTDMYISICVDLSSMSNVMTRINNMTLHQENVLFAIAGLDAQAFDTTVNDALSIISAYNNATFIESPTEGAIGSIRTTFVLG